MLREASCSTHTRGNIGGRSAERYAAPKDERYSSDKRRFSATNKSLIFLVKLGFGYRLNIDMSYWKVVSIGVNPNRLGT